MRGADGTGRRGFLAPEWPEEPTIRYACHWQFRREKLCPGTYSCGEAQQESGGEEPCFECPSVKLDEFMSDTSRGRLLGAVIRIDRLRNAGITFGPGDLTYAEALVLDLLSQERDAYTEERIKESTRKVRG